MNIPQLDSTYIANTYARFPVTIARGKGSLVWDADDKVYIDMAVSYTHLTLPTKLEV